VSTSPTDRALRALLGSALVGSAVMVFGLSSGRVAGVTLAMLGAGLLITGAVGFSVLDALLGLKTCSEC
jgi:hypothetical protein